MVTQIVLVELTGDVYAYSRKRFGPVAELQGTTSMLSVGARSQLIARRSTDIVKLTIISVNGAVVVVLLPQI